jgi:D-sedoheptulose 7-phosphate isomerase
MARQAYGNRFDDTSMKERIKQYAEASIEAKRNFFAANVDAIVRAAEVLIEAIQAGGKVLFFGNGGSAADAQHLAAELVNRLTYDRPPIAAIALTTDTSILTSVGNDASFEALFERQVRALGRAGDVVIAISTSGNSPNVVRAVEAARAMNLKVVALAGHSGGRLAPLADVALVVEAANTQHIQETHITIGHILCELVENALYSQPQT